MLTYLLIAAGTLLPLCVSYTVNSISADGAFSSSSVLEGSIEGGTILHFKGEFGTSHPSEYRIQIGPSECQLQDEPHSASLLQCETPPSPSSGPSVYAISISHLSEPVDTRSLENVHFTYSDNKTPHLYWMSPSEQLPNEASWLFGDWISADPGDFEGLDSDGTFTEFSGNVGPTGGVGAVTVKSTVGGKGVHGIHQPNIRVGQYGLMQKDWLGTQSTLSGILFSFKIIARVQRLSQNYASKLGGLELELFGAAFPDNVNRVKVVVNGENCPVAVSGFSYIRCRTPAAENSSDKYYEGSAGLIREVWYGQSSDLDFSKLIGYIAPYERNHLATAEVPVTAEKNAKGRVFGLFVPSSTGYYTFYCAAAGQAEVHLSPDWQPKNVRKIITQDQPAHRRQYFGEKHRESEKILLEEGKKYYVEGRYASGENAEHFSMGLQAPGSGDMPNRMPLVQQLFLEKTETQKEYQELFITAGRRGPIGGGLQLKYGARSTQVIRWDESIRMWDCDSILDMLGTIDLHNMLCEGKRDNNVIYYKLTFNSDKTGERHQFLINTNRIEPTEHIQYESKRFQERIPPEETYLFSYKGQSWEFNNKQDYNQLGHILNREISTLKRNLVVYNEEVGNGNNLYFMLPPNMWESDEDSIEITKGLRSMAETLQRPGNDRFWWVIPSDFLRTEELLPQVRLFIDGAPTICTGDCSFVFLDPPRITEFSVSDGVLTIGGDRFSTDNRKLTITVGGAECEILTVSKTTYTCRLSTGTAGSHLPLVKDDRIGFYQVDSQLAGTISFPLTVTSISPAGGATGGHTLLTIKGTGFSSKPSKYQSVRIGHSPCEILSCTPTEITCLTTKETSGSVMTVTVNSESATSDAFQYNPDLDVLVYEISPTQGKSLFINEITLFGKNFGHDPRAITVMIGEESCHIVTASNREIYCKLLGGPRGRYSVVVSVAEKGKTRWNKEFPLLFEVNSVSMHSGSLNGGTQLVIKGNGFTNTERVLKVQIGDKGVECRVTQLIDDHSFACVTPALPDGFAPETSYTVSVLGKLNVAADCTGDCSFAWTSEKTPIVYWFSASGQNYIDLNGKGFSTDKGKIQFKVGGVDAEISYADEQYIESTIPRVKGLRPSLSLLIEDMGYATFEETLRNEIFIQGVSPASVSQAGGNVRIEGSGFHQDMEIHFGPVSCNILLVDDKYVLCSTASYTADELEKHLEIRSEHREFRCEGHCAISFDRKITPKIEGVSGNLRISGDFIEDLTTTAAHVMVGEYPCKLSKSSRTQIECSPQAPPGTYNVVVFINSYGYATGNFQYTVTHYVSSIERTYSSYGGGRTLTLRGSGLSVSTTIEVCGEKGEITSASGYELTFVTPELLTVYSQDTFVIRTEPEWLESFTKISSNPAETEKAFDNDLHSFYSDSEGPEAWVGVDVGEDRVFQLHSFQFYGGGLDREFYENLQGSVVQGSTDGVHWDDLFEYNFVYGHWNVWETPVNQDSEDSYSEYRYRLYRLLKRNVPENYYINEIALKGFLLAAETAPETACAIVVSSRNAEPTSENTLVYSSAVTPVVKRFDPQQGPTMGGTLITFTGTGFGSSPSGITIQIDQVPCKVHYTSETEMKCITGPRPSYSPASLTVHIEGNGSAVTHGRTFLYAEHWSHSSTWGGVAPPLKGESVHIPKGKNVILDLPTPELDSILVEGCLIVSDQPGMKLEANSIVVDGGWFSIGTEDSPFLNDIEVVIHGGVQSPTMPVIGNKVIAVRAGVIDLHGKPRDPTWTFLHSTASPGDSSLTLTADVDWAVGEEIVIASTSFDHEEAEVRTIRAVTGRILTFNAPLKHKHYAGVETYGEHNAEFRAEVGLLTRNIKIYGSAQDTDKGHGVHMILSSTHNATVTARIQYTEFSQAGQGLSQGRHPIHFRGLGEAASSYVIGNSIHNTYSRAIALHQVNYLRVLNNVAYRNSGHAYFIGGGTETHNRIENNLGVSTAASWSLLDSDRHPATFWAASPNNFFVKNRAAGSDAHGFHFELAERLSSGSTCPAHEHLGAFEGNAAHSARESGLRISPRFVPLRDPCAAESQTAHSAEIANFTVWKSKRGIHAQEIGAIQFSSIISADNLHSGIAIEISHSARISHSLVIGESGNTENNVQGAVGVRTPQNDGLLVDSVKFAHFSAELWPLGSGESAGAHRFRSLTFEDSHRRINWGSSSSGIYEILDDSLTGEPNSFVAAPWDHLLTSNCVKSALYNSVVCTGDPAIRRVSLSGLSPFVQFDKQPLEVTLTTGSLTSLIPMTLNQTWDVPVVTGEQYSLHWDGPPLNWEGMTMEISTFKGTEHVFFSFERIPSKHSYQVTRDAETDPEAQYRVDPTRIFRVKRDLDPNDRAGTHSWDDSQFDIILGGRAYNQQFGALTITASNPAVVLSQITELTQSGIECRWSDPSCWPALTIPTSNDDVVISSGTKMLLDTETPVLSSLEVNGVLEFDREQDVTLRAKRIFIRAGTIKSGSAESPLSPEVTHQVILHGEQDDEVFVFNGEVHAGNNVIVNTGKLELYGAPKVPWSVLEQNAYPGDDFLFVQNVDWKAGDRIVVAPSGFSAVESELRTVIGVQSGADVEFREDFDWEARDSLRRLGKYHEHLDTSIETETSSVSRSSVSKLFLDRPLLYYHSGTDVLIDQESVNMRTEVGLLNRNIVVKSASEWGCSILTSDLTDLYTAAGAVERSGSVRLVNVELDKCGQRDSERAALRFQLNRNGQGSLIEASVVKNTGSWAVSLDGALKVNFKNSVVFNTLWRGVVVLEAEDSHFYDNLVVGVLPRQGRDLHVDKPAGFLTCIQERHCKNVQVKRNRVAGSPFAGFIASGSAGDSGSFDYNLAHSGGIGWVIANPPSRTISSTGFQGFFNHIGVAAYTAAYNFDLDGVKLAENSIGIAVRSGIKAHGESVHFRLSDSVIVGKTQHSFCGTEDCESLDCTARTGFYTFTSDTQESQMTLNDTIPLLLYEPQSAPNALGSAELEGVTFANFRHHQKCSIKQFAIETNPLNDEYTVPHTVKNLHFQSVPHDSLLYMNEPGRQGQCGPFGCTGLANVLITDRDGSILSGRPGAILPNNPGIAKSGLCEFKQALNAYFCTYDETGDYYEMLVFEVLSGSTFRAFPPVTLSSASLSFTSHSGVGYSNKLHNFMVRRFNGATRERVLYNRYAAVVYTGLYYNSTSAGVNPRDMRIWLQGTEGRNRGIVYTVDCQGPNNMQVYSGEDRIKGLEYSLTEDKSVKAQDTHGTNKWFHEDTQLQLALTNEDPLDVLAQNALRIKLTLEMHIREFASGPRIGHFVGKLAGALGIDTQRVRVASMEEGSTVFHLFIERDHRRGPYDRQGEIEELEGIWQLVQGLEEAGELDKELEMKVLTIRVVMNEQIYDGTGNESREIQALEIYLLIITGIILFIFVVMLAIILLRCCKERGKFGPREVPGYKGYQVENVETERDEQGKAIN